VTRFQVLQRIAYRNSKTRCLKLRELSINRRPRRWSKPIHWSTTFSRLIYSWRAKSSVSRSAYAGLISTLSSLLSSKRRSLSSTNRSSWITKREVSWLFSTRTTKKHWSYFTNCTVPLMKVSSPSLINSRSSSLRPAARCSSRVRLRKMAKISLSRWSLSIPNSSKKCWKHSTITGMSSTSASLETRYLTDASSWVSRTSSTSILASSLCLKCWPSTVIRCLDVVESRETRSSWKSNLTRLRNFSLTCRRRISSWRSIATSWQEDCFRKLTKISNSKRLWLHD